MTAIPVKNSSVPTKQPTNTWLDTMDSRHALTRQLRERFVALTDDLGGADRLSYAQRSLCERALWLEYWLAQQERQLATGSAADFDVARWTQAANSLQGILYKLGLKRVARESVDLQTFLRQRAGGAQS